MKKYMAMCKLRDKYADLVVGGLRVGLSINGWERNGRFRYQVMHWDVDNASFAFYRAVGIQPPRRFAIKRVTVGSFDRMIGYLKLHIEPNQRYVRREGEEEVEDEEDE
jgi:hypothetical protein